MQGKSWRPTQTTVFQDIIPQQHQISQIPRNAPDHLHSALVSPSHVSTCDNTQCHYPSTLDSQTPSKLRRCHPTPPSPRSLSQRFLFPTAHSGLHSAWESFSHTERSPRAWLLLALISRMLYRVRKPAQSEHHWHIGGSEPRRGDAQDYLSFQTIRGRTLSCLAFQTNSNAPTFVADRNQYIASPTELRPLQPLLVDQ